ncbi:hypothetical protein PR202_ga20517 [Eleusine coracana subsp. coracana]|uniref:N-acetylglucosaminylphosphatidylinositol deacetylase n=1 Tax=Eleusine coracana subsp. coracana TaxID=191504 RepID=A0AAV5CYG4_ELECO|nr:hypothetical protein PR202_ga20517 [Eleusine coracana subsp. coracana]
MAWIWMLSAAGAVLLWAISLGRILSSPAPSCLPPSPHFMSPLRGDRRSRNVLLVIAHPDDESMFFAPTILFLKSKGHNVHVLCMSQGNADGLGNTRKEELYHACDTFKIQRKQVQVLDHLKLQILTFDSHGVSGHPNHQDVHHGICKFLHENGQGNIEAWQLASLNLFRKYSGPLDIWLASRITSSSKDPTYTLVNSSPSRSYQAMVAHRSQWVW